MGHREQSLVLIFYKLKIKAMASINGEHMLLQRFKRHGASGCNSSDVASLVLER